MDTEKRTRRTTIDIDSELFRKLKKYAAERDNTIRGVVTEALEEKFRREAVPGGIEKIEDANFAGKIISELSRLMPRKSAETILSNECSRYGITPDILTPQIMMPEMVERLCFPVVFLENEETAEELRNKLLRMIEGASNVQGFT